MAFSSTSASSTASMAVEAHDLVKVGIDRLHHSIDKRRLIHHHLSKALQPDQVHMVQRLNAPPPRQNLVIVEVRFDQPYYGRDAGPIRGRKKRAPALRPYQLREPKGPIDRSTFVFGPKFHHSHPFLEFRTEEETPQAANTTKNHATHVSTAGASQTRPIILHCPARLNVQN